MTDREMFRTLRRTGDPAVRSALITEHLRLAYRLAHTFAGRGEPPEDLKQVAAMGLVHAVDRFDPDRGTAFSTFAVPTIVGELKRHLRETRWALRVTREVKELALSLSDRIQRATARIGRPPTVPELAEAENVSQERVVEALAAWNACSVASLDAAIEGQQDLPSSLGAPDPRLEHAESRICAGEAWRELPARTREMVVLWAVEGRSQTDIARRFGVSQVQVSRVVRGALRRVQAAAQMAGPEV